MQYDQTQKGGWGWICIVAVVEGFNLVATWLIALDAQMHVMHFVCLGAWVCSCFAFAFALAFAVALNSVTDPCNTQRQRKGVER